MTAPEVRAWLDGLDQARAVSPLYAPSAGEHPSSRTTTPAERESFVRNESRAAS